MRRILLTYIAPSIAMMLAVVTCVLLAQWQWHIGFRNQTQVLASASTEIQTFADVSTAEQWLPRTSIGARTRVRGHLLNAHTFRTAARPSAGAMLPWVVTPLRLSDGSVVTVVRGAGGPAVLPGEVTITGRMQPSEDSPAVGVWQPAAPELSTSRMVNRWTSDVIRDGYLVDESSSTLIRGVTATPRFTAAPSGHINWRNIAYACQWLLFALFALFVWWRQVAPAPEGNNYPHGNT